MKKPVFILFFSLISILFFQSCSLQKQDEDIQILSIKKVVNKNSPDYEICSSFTLEKVDVINYFSLAEEVDAHTFHSEAIILPCKYKGTINFDKTALQWEINAGGAGYLYNDKKTDKRYLCKENCCKVFLYLC